MRRDLAKIEGVLIGVIGLMLSVAVFGQAATSPQLPPSPLAELDAYLKVIGAIIVALGALFGLPTVFLTYRKTRAEIAKLDLEAAALREKVPPSSPSGGPDEGGIRINVEHSRDVNVQVLADPRFLAPLLLLLDFIFAWIVLTLAGYLLGIFGLGILRTFFLAVLAAILLLPIAKQVVRVRAVLRPPQSEQEIRASVSQVRMVVYITYLMLTASPFALGVLILVLEPQYRYVAWGLIALGIALVVLIPILKPRVDRYLVTLLRPTGSA